MMGTECWAIKYKPGTQGDWLGPTLVSIEDDTVYWNGGPSHMTVHDWDTIKFVKQYENNYEEDSNEWWDRYGEISNQFEKDFPPEAELKVSASWMAPDGKFYPCRYMEHLDLAYRLALVHYDSDDGEKKLESEGWAKVWTDGTIMLGDWDTSRCEYTQAQIDTLGDLLVLAKQEDRESYAANIARELKTLADMEQ